MLNDSTTPRKVELVCPAGSYPAAKAAIDNGADAIYLGFKNATNARHFPGLNFGDNAISKAIRYAFENKKKVFLAINTYPQTDTWTYWTDSIDKAIDFGIKTLILCDIGLIEYTKGKYPHIDIHLSVQASASSAFDLNFYHENFGIKRAVLPRVLNLADIERICSSTPVEIEVFAFGSLCIMAEGRCLLSSHTTGLSPNTYGACSPANSVKWTNSERGYDFRLNNILLDSFSEKEMSGYPTPCKGRFITNDSSGYPFSDPSSLNTLEILPSLINCGIQALKIEGRQRSPAYVSQVTQVWREAIDSYYQSHTPEDFLIKDRWISTLNKISEGTQTCFGAYDEDWK